MNTRLKKNLFTPRHLSIFGFLCCIFTACNPSPQTSSISVETSSITIPDLQSGQEAISFLGDTLVRRTMSEASFHLADSLLEEALTFYREDSTELLNIIWYGRRLSYLHRYREAIDIYTLGLQHHPEASELYRHRGHRYLTIRQIDLAIQDLEQAAILVKNREIEIEPDGLPNKLDIPLSNLHFNIYYHLGLAYYLKPDYPMAIQTLKSCMRFSDNADLKVATTFWLYLSHMRANDLVGAEMLLSDIHPDMEIIENEAYHRQLLLFKTNHQPDIALEADTLPYASTHYGIHCWHDAHGRKGEAASIRRKILSSTHWPMFGYLAAEADSSRLIVQ